MRSSTVLPFLFALSSALPKTPARSVLTENDIIVMTDGEPVVMDKATYYAENPQLAPLPSANTTTTTNVIRSDRLEARGCKWADIYTLNEPQYFLNWDVPMSSIIKAGETTATVAVTEGYQIANAIAITETVGVTVSDAAIGLAMTASLAIAYTDTWTSTYTAAYTFTVPIGKYGIVVSNPSTTRHTGWVDSGCVGTGDGRTSFQADSYESKSFGGLR